MNNVVLFFILLLSTQSLTEKTLVQVPRKTAVTKEPSPPKKRRLTKAPFIKLYGKNKIYK